MTGSLTLRDHPARAAWFFANVVALVTLFLPLQISAQEATELTLACEYEHQEQLLNSGNIKTSAHSGRIDAKNFDAT
jgi:hypothetical protein